MMEHGCGQTFRHPDGRLLGHPSYAGARRHGVELLLTPGANATKAYRQGHAAARIVEIGCPKLEPWKALPEPPLVNGKRVLAFAFHWDCKVVPETGSAWREYLATGNFHRTLAALQRDWHVIGHGHPRVINHIAPIYREHGVPVIRDFSDVVKQAHVLAVDSSSVLFEFAALERPVVVLNSERYRRGVEHGLRFWEGATIGPQVNHEQELPRQALAALEWPVEKRRAAVALAYADVTNGAAIAANAILEVFSGT